MIREREVGLVKYLQEMMICLKGAPIPSALRAFLQLPPEAEAESEPSGILVHSTLEETDTVPITTPKRISTPKITPPPALYLRSDAHGTNHHPQKSTPKEHPQIAPPNSTPKYPSIATPITTPIATPIASPIATRIATPIASPIASRILPPQVILVAYQLPLHVRRGADGGWVVEWDTDSVLHCEALKLSTRAIWVGCVSATVPPAEQATPHSPTPPATPHTLPMHHHHMCPPPP